VAAALSAAGSAWAQAGVLTGSAPAASVELSSLALPNAPISQPVTLPDPIVPSPSTAPAGPYVMPTPGARFRNYAWNAVGPVAFAGAGFAGAIDQGFDFQKKWGQGANAYGVRVASNLGISMVTATAQYSLAEAFHEDTVFYRCTCSGLGRRFFHAAMSSVTARRGDDGHRALSAALIVSPFVGPMVAANTWIPTHNGPRLGFNMGAHNLLGQFAQDEALEFVYGGPNTMLGHIQRHIKWLPGRAR
jgi:hypothetical protein